MPKIKKIVYGTYKIIEFLEKVGANRNTIYKKS